MVSNRYKHGKLLGLLLPCMLGFVSALNAAEGNDPIEIPFTFYRDSIVVEAKVNGRGPFSMILDTGVNPSVIDRSTAQEIGLRVSAQGEQGSGTGKEGNLSYETSLPLVELGGLKAEKVEALATDLSKMSAAFGKPLQGVLGYSLLKDRVVQFDYPKRVVRFYRRTPYARAEQSRNDPRNTTLPFIFRDDILVKNILVDGEKVIATFDTGSNNTFQLTPAAIARVGLEKDVSKAQPTHSAGFNGTAENRTGKVRSITIGGIYLREPAVVFYSKGAGYDDAAWALRIGNGFFKDFVMTVDYQNQLITLERGGGVPEGQ